MSSRLLLFRIATVSIPLVVLILLEIVLRFAGVGADNRRAFVEVPSNDAYLAPNPAFPAKYFRGFRPAVPLEPFRRNKREGTFRVFVLGGSSAAGFPYQFYHGFPARLEAILRSQLPDQTVEVVNYGMTAVNSYTLWDLVGHVLEQKPDAVIVYAGHNEYYGAYGVGSAQRGLSASTLFKRSVLRMKRLATYALLEDLLVATPEPVSETRTMMARVVDDAEIENGSRAFDAGIAQFRSNLSRLVAAAQNAGVDVYLGTVTSNLADQPPLGEDSTAIASFRRGKALYSAGKFARARAAFVESREHDEIRFRAPSAINEVIRQMAAEDGVHLVDVEQVVRHESPNGIEDSTLFTDHLHPNDVGYSLIAEAFAESIKDHRGLARLLTSTNVNEHRYLDPMDRRQASIQIERLRLGYPFRKDRSEAEELSDLRRLLDRYLNGASRSDSLAAVAAAQAVPVQQALYEGVQHALSVSDTATALQFYRSLLHWQPFNKRIADDAVALAVHRPRFDSLVAPIAALAAVRHDDVDFWNSLAAVRVRQEQYDVANRVLTLVEERDPSSPVMLFNKARLLVLTGDTVSARTYFDRYRVAVGQ